MKQSNSFTFNEGACLHHLRHYLPAQAPLKDFIHHNTLHAFQEDHFHHALLKANTFFGYQVYLSVNEYQKKYKNGEIKLEVLEKVVERHKKDQFDTWIDKLLSNSESVESTSRIGKLRSYWKSIYHINLDKAIHPLLFRITGSYLDQGVSLWHFPVSKRGFLASVRELESNSYQHFIKGKRARNLLLKTHLKMEQLLEILIGKSELYEQYLFDQQFAHPGWSGMAATLEHKRDSLLHDRRISLHDLICLELLLEIDHLDQAFGENWRPLGSRISQSIPALFSPVKSSEHHQLQILWQEAYEWSYFDQVLIGLCKTSLIAQTNSKASFQAVFCIDDRECSLRRYLEHFEPDCKTFGTAGFFNVAFYFQPRDSDFYTKVCPAPLQPGHLIKESKPEAGEDSGLRKKTVGKSNWLLSQVNDIVAAIKLMFNIIKPTKSTAMVCSFDHMKEDSELTVECKDTQHKHNGLQVGFTLIEMADRVEGLLRTIGLVKDFGAWVYIVGHGASSINNTHYAGYDCGACSGRPGSVNARVFAQMANHKEVRKILRDRNIEIPDHTFFAGCIHDTTRDEIRFYEKDFPEGCNVDLHKTNKQTFEHALSFNARERSRRFVLMNTRKAAEKVHEKVKLRSMALFEPRPELNHATNALCIVGRRSFSQRLFLDRRSFLQSYDYQIDPEGDYLTGIMNAIAPVCGGINLEYYFSKVDNQRLGAGTKLPHNVMGLIGVANGMDGDLRPGLPSQMIEVHDPVRLLVIVEQLPEIVQRAISKEPATKQWFDNNWIHLIAITPDDRKCFRYQNGEFSLYYPADLHVEQCDNVLPVILKSTDSLPVYLMK